MAAADQPPSEPVHRDRLPQLQGGRPFLADGGLETDLIFNRGLDLPCFAAFDLLRREGGRDELRAYFRPFLETARRHHAGFILDTVTWRANPDWGAELGYSPNELDAANRDAVAFAEEIRAAEGDGAGPIVIAGVVGPRGDGYSPERLMSSDEAAEYHSRQIGVFAGSAADMVAGITVNYAEEGVGIASAAAAAGMPVAISFTVETDGRLPTGQTLGEAIDQVEAETAAAPAYYMINCAHPTHFEGVLDADARWLERIGGIRANASKMSHAELDEAEELDDGNPDELAAEYAELAERLGGVHVLGGCCGTDSRHIAAVAGACLAAASES